jgi:hypothetical protein
MRTTSQRDGNARARHANDHVHICIRARALTGAERRRSNRRSSRTRTTRVRDAKAPITRVAGTGRPLLSGRLTSDWKATYSQASPFNNHYASGD